MASRLNMEFIRNGFLGMSREHGWTWILVFWKSNVTFKKVAITALLSCITAWNYLLCCIQCKVILWSFLEHEWEAMDEIFGNRLLVIKENLFPVVLTVRIIDVGKDASSEEVLLILFDPCVLSFQPHRHPSLSCPCLFILRRPLTSDHGFLNQRDKR